MITINNGVGGNITLNPGKTSGKIIIGEKNDDNRTIKCDNAEGQAGGQGSPSDNPAPRKNLIIEGANGFGSGTGTGGKIQITGGTGGNKGQGSSTSNTKERR